MDRYRLTALSWMVGSSPFLRLGVVGMKISWVLSRSRRAAQQGLQMGHGSMNAFHCFAATIRLSGGDIKAASAMGLRV